MKKYSFVNLAVCMPQEMKEEIRKHCFTKSLGYSMPEAIVLPYVKKSNYNTQFDFNSLNNMKRDFPLICEINEEKNVLTEIVTGRNFKRYNYNGPNDITKITMTDCCYISTSDVIKLLQSLSENEIMSYKKNLNSLIKHIQYGYQDYQIRLNKEDEDDAYIKSFREKYGKKK